MNLHILWLDILRTCKDCDYTLSTNWYYSVLILQEKCYYEKLYFFWLCVDIYFIKLKDKLVKKRTDEHLKYGIFLNIVKFLYLK